jgi:ATP-dependent helicase/nuclease subunit A
VKLTPQQHDAIHRTGQDVCVIAGPGSGKTRVLAERFAWLVNAQDVSPRNILALTFTEKAASEIKDRVSKSKHPEIELAPISTFHGLCSRILKEFSIAAGLDPTTELWDERLADAELHASAEDVLNEAAHNETAQLRRLFTTWNAANLVPDLCDLYNKIRSLSDEFPTPTQAPNILSLLSDFIAIGEDVAAAKPSTPPSQRFHESFCQSLNTLRELGPQPSWSHIATLEEFPKRGNLPKGLKEPAKLFYDLIDTISAMLVSSLVAPERNYLITLLTRISDRYDARKRAAARMDFHDLEHKSIHLLRTNPKVREDLQRRFEHILMDEMQDTNPVQWKLLNLLRTPGTFFAVGDVNQSIYGFRFAAPKEFIEYRDSIVSTGGVIDFLGHNFRSRAEVLAFTEVVSRDLKGIETPGLTAGRNFQTQNKPVSIHPFEQHEDEFAWLAFEIQELQHSFIVEPKGGAPLRRLSLSDVAILVRTASKSEDIAATLAAHNIPFTLGGGRKFFDTQEVADMLSYFELLANPLNTVARAAVLRSPFVGLSDAQLLDYDSSPAFDSLLASQRDRLDDTAPDRFLLEALDRSGYLQTLNPGGRSNIDKFLRITRELWQQGPRTMRDFVDELQQMRRAAQEKSAPVSGQGEAVHILTVHASKGLEFPVVFVAGCCFSKPANRASLSFAPSDRVGVRWTNPITGKTLPDSQARAIAEEQKLEEEHELQRQLYVALTRAEQRLYVSWAGKRRSGWLKYLNAHQAIDYPAGPPQLMPATTTASSTPAPLLLHPLPPQPVQLSATNPTELAKYALCPRRMFLDSIAGLNSWPREIESTGATTLGTAVHQILAGQPVEDDTPEARALAQVALDSPLSQALKEALWVEREFDFIFAIDDLVIDGTIDLCFESPDGTITILDYKTDRTIKPAYDTQMAIYREAIARLHPGKPIRSELYYLRPNQRLESNTPLDKQLLKAFATADRFPTNAGPHCQRCPHLAQACPVTSTS